MTGTPATVRGLVADVLRYLARIGLDAVRDVVQLPFVVLKALLGLLSADASRARMLLVRQLLDALRDLVLFPLILAAAGIDLLLAPFRAPALFYALRRFDLRCDHLLDRWLEVAWHVRPRAARFDDVLSGLEEAMRDPDRSERRARLLRRRAQRKRRTRAG